jgi:hypothetical protein
MASKIPTVVRINGSVEWKILKAKAGNWVAICDSLKLTLQADTWANLMEDIAFTLDAILKDLLSSNELNRFMKEHGWKLVGRIPHRQADMRFDLPFITAMMSSHGSQRNLHQ